MNLIKELRKSSLLGKLLTYVLILLSSTIIIFLSFNVNISYKSNSSYLWFTRISQILYTILIGYSLINIIKLFYMLKNAGNVKELNENLKNLDNNEIHVVSKPTLTNSFIMNNVISENSTLNDNQIVDSFNKILNSVKNDFDLTFKGGINEYLPLPLVITNKDGKIIQCNDLARNFFKSSLINKNIGEFIDPLDSSIIDGFTVVNAIVLHESKKNIVSSIFQTSVFKQNKVLSYVVLLFLPCPVNNKDNIDLDKSIHANNDVVQDKKDSLCSIIHLSSSILENFGNYLNFGILILNKDNNIIGVNNKSVELLSHDLFVSYNKITNRSDIINKHFKDIFYSALKNDQVSSLLNNDIAQIQLNIKNTFFLEIHSQKLDENRVITLLDISEKRKLELQNNFSQRLQTIGQIASAVAHDFNNLLTAIMSFTYFLKEKYTSEDSSTLELKQIEQNANRAKVMIRQLLTFSRGKDLNPINFAVNSEISNLMSTILRLMGERIKTEFIRGKNIGEITMDPVQFQQVIINLVVNARDAMKNGGNLTISTEKISLKQSKEAVIVTIPPGDYIVINIKDEGEGIDKVNFKRIFQTHFSTKGDKGNGLGLATVAKIMQENSGYIYLESVLSKGSIFSLYFPTEYNESLNAEEKINELTSVVKLNKLPEEITIDLTGDETILLVEDEIPVRTVCKRALVSKGYKVIEAEDAEHALSLLQNSANNVDLIISDVMMPGLSGLEFISEARKLNPNIKAILMSGYAEDTLEDNHYTLDSIEFLAKPFNPDVLTTKVKKVINNQLGD